MVEDTTFIAINRKYSVMWAFWVNLFKGHFKEHYKHSEKGVIESEAYEKKQSGSIVQ